MIEVIADPPNLLQVATAERIAARAARIAERIEQCEGVVFGTVSIAIVDTNRISSLHEEYLDDPSPTDVITFPGNAFGDESEIEGDVAICFDVAQEQAAEAGHDTIDEIVFLATHGLLHLCGWRDEDQDARADMLAFQRRLMDAVGQTAE